MNIVYFSNLSTNIAAGLNWSVPAGIHAQSKIDNVLWVNLTEVEMPHWREVACFHNASEFGGYDLDLLPEPFNSPDFVVFEGFYHPKDPKIAKLLRKRGIPYIIIPRGSLTRQAQHGSLRKHLKKMIANLIIFKPYTRRAAAIQYLTEAEKNDSGSRWNDTSFVIPNGFNTPSVRKSAFSSDRVKAIFIGRLDYYHKGLDELLRGCTLYQEDLRSGNFTLDIYGPARYDFDKIKQYINNNNIGDFVTLKGEISGKDKENALLEADLFILTSRFEGHPMGLIEALAYGVPVLVSPGSNMATEIENADAGWVCKTEAHDIADKLKLIIASRHTLSSKGQSAAELASGYDWDVLARRFHAELSKI